MKPADYLRQTRHPWPSLCFVVPLLAAYEGGILYAGSQGGQLRNGADAWFRRGLDELGSWNHQAAAPLLVVAVLGLWSALRWTKRPTELGTLCPGMLIESVVFALGLWGLSRAFGPLLDFVNAKMSVNPPHADTVSRLVTFVGAGIYEEVIFRLGLYGGLRWLILQSQMPPAGATASAALVSAILFAAAHHVGPSGEAVDGYVFSFRMLAGAYFALLYQYRGFGVAAGAHAGYDMLVGVMWAK